MPAPTNVARTRAARAVRDWFTDTGRKPFRFQTQTWKAYAAGESGLIHATTGTGKTLAAWLGPVIDGLARGELADPAKAGETETKRRRRSPPLRVLWITRCGPSPAIRSTPSACRSTPSA